MRRSALNVGLLGVLVLHGAVACERQGSTPNGATSARTTPSIGADTRREETTMKLGSSAFAANGSMPAQHTCEGANVSPPLAWTEAPHGTKSFALVVHDPDAPDPAAPKRDWVHWIVYNLPASCAALGEAAVDLPTSARQGINDWDKPSYGGPCPPIGRHRYFFELFALDTLLPELPGPKRGDVERAMQGHVLATASLVGTYQKQK
jgi:Raf kinase inhibitor-like YbhB/YbcL family protein